MRLIIGLLTLALVNTAPANAWNVHGSAGGGGGTNTALSGVNVISPAMFPFVNLVKTATSGFSGLSSSFLYPNYLQNATNLPTGTIPAGKNLGYGVFLPSTYFGKYVFSMQGTAPAAGVNAGIQIGGSGAQGQIYSAGAGTSILGCNNGNVPPCYFSNNVFIGGTNPTITFDFSAPVTNATNNGSGLIRLAIVNSSLSNGEQVTIANVVGSDGNGCGANGVWTLANVTGTTVDLSGSTFPGGCTYTSGGQLFVQVSGSPLQTGLSWASGTYSGVSSVVWCKLADYTADNTCNTTAGHTAWAGGFNDDFITQLAALKNHHIRFLDANNATFGIPQDWNGYQTTSAFSYYTIYGWYEITNWFGAASGTNSYAVSCASPCTYTLTGGAPADGDVFHVYFANANTSMSPTLTVTDANSVTSSAIPLFVEDEQPITVTFGGTATAGDTIALRFNSTALGAYTCLAGGTHTTSAYTVQAGDTPGSIQNQVTVIVQNDATLAAQPTAVVASNPFGGSGTFYIGNANNACTITVTPVITGLATETVSIGTMPVGTIPANSIFTGIYNSLLKGIMLNTRSGGGHRPAWPWSVQVNLAKALTAKQGVNVGCWLQTNLLWSNASFTSFANYMASNPCPGETILELSNEVGFVFNPETAQAPALATSLGLGADALAYYNLRQRQLWAIAQSSFSGNPTNLVTGGMYQLGTGANSSELAGTPLCGTSSCTQWGNNNQAYQRVIGTNYNSAPNRPIDFMTVIGQAPYYQGAILDNSYNAAASYGSWSATSSSVASNVMTVSGTVTGTIFWNQGISSCDGTYLKVPNQSDPTSFQLTGKVTTTLNGATARNTATWTLTSVAGLQPGMWIFDQTTGLGQSTIASINAGANQITLTTPGGITVYPSAGANDTLVFGGKAGTYQLNSTTCAAASGTITGGDILGLRYAADNFNSLNSAVGSVQDAYDWMYIDTYWGVNSGLMFGMRTLNDASSLIATTANTYGKKVWDYEGGFQGHPPSNTDATNMGLPSSSYGYTNQAQNNGYIGNLINSWKNNVGFKNIETLRHNNEIAILPTGSMTMWYAFEDGSNLPLWSLYPGDLYAPAPYQSYNAIGCYNGNAGLC